MRAFVTGGSGFVGRNLIARLRAEGHEVRALARSSDAEQAVRDAGGEPVRGDLDSVDAMREGMRGTDVVFHAAAYTKEWGTADEFRHATIDGTAHVLAAARDAGVPRLVHVSTEAVLVGGAPLIDVDETRPIPPKHAGLYPWSKAAAEALVRAANTPTLATIVVRPRFVWGQGDTSLLPKIADAVRAGSFAWIGGGRYPTSTCHVANMCEALVRAAEKGRGGEVYFATDGAPVEFRAFVGELLQTQGLAPPTREVPRWVARTLAAVTEPLWRAVGAKNAPPVTRTAVRLIGEQVTVDDRKARRELGYVGAMTRAQGLAAMRAS